LATVKKPEHGSIEWLTIRKSDDNGRIRFGASEAPTLMGANPYQTIADLALNKWAPTEVSEQNDAMLRGNVLEPALVTYAAQLIDQPVITPDVMYANGRLIATLDGLSQDGSVIVEAKTTTSYSSDDDIPAAYYWQAVAQLFCCPSADRVLVVVLDKRMRLGSWIVDSNNDTVISDMAHLADQADTVGQYLDRREMPPDAGVKERHIIAMYPEPGGSVELDSEGVFVLRSWIAAKEARKNAETEEQMWRDQLVVLLGAADVGCVDSEPVVTYKQRKGASTVDWKAVAKDHKSLLDQYRKQGAPTRVLKSVLDTGKDGE
jgi:putative phage-type endonuclease